MTDVVYKANDVIEVRLDKRMAEALNKNKFPCFQPHDIIGHRSAPEPVVRWVNVYDDRSIYAHTTKESAERSAIDRDIFLLRMEWPDGDMAKAPIVTLEG